MLKPKFCFAEHQQDSCYALAGSFTGFLIRSFGWTAYKNFYRKVKKSRLPATFRKAFGITIDEADYRWRKYLFPVRTVRQ